MRWIGERALYALVLATSVVGVVMVLALAHVARAEVYVLDTSKAPISVTCGGAAADVPAGTYELLVSSATGEAVRVCWAATCASGGVRRQPGNHGAIRLRSPAKLSCDGNGAVDLQPLVEVQ